MAQYDPIAIKSGIPSVLGSDTMRADKTAEGGLTTSAPTAGDVCQVSGNLTMIKALNTSTSPIIGVYEGTSGSVVREGVVVANFKTAPTENGVAVYLSSTAGQLTTTKPTMDMLHEVGVVVDAANSKILLQQKPVISLPASPPLTLWTGYWIQLGVWSCANDALIGTSEIGWNYLGAPCFDGNLVWCQGYEGLIYAHDATTRVKVKGPYNIGRPANYSGQQMPFDGTNYWTYDTYSTPHHVHKFDANGNVLATLDLTPGDWGAPTGCLTYDGAGSVWAATQSRPYSYSSIFKIPVSGSVVTATAVLPGYVLSSFCVANGYLWVPYYHRDTMQGHLAQIRLSDAAVVNDFNLATNRVYGGICWDGNYFWMTVGSDGNTMAIVTPTGTVVTTWVLPSYPSASLCFDGTYVYVVGGYILKYRASDRAYVHNQQIEGSCYGGCLTGNVLPWP